MAIELSITPEDVEAIVKDALIKAGLGKAISDGVKKALSGYESPVDKEVKLYVGEVAATLIKEKYAEQIKASVSAAIEARVTKEFLDKTVADTITKMEKAAAGLRY